MSLGEVGQRLREVLLKAEQLINALRQAESLAKDACELLGPAGRGSRHEDDYSAVLRHWNDAHVGVGDLVTQAQQVSERLADHLRSLLGAGAGAGAEPVPPDLSWSAQQRATLPAYDGKTTGKYVDPDGYTDSVRSGYEPDGEHDEIAEFLFARGYPPGPAGARVTLGVHVEAKVAWRMRAGGVDRVELVINNPMCRGPYSCTKLLQEILLPGQTLVIHDPRATRVHRGKEAR
ncbi:DddA-like double-stranded DNA deaminase toxin [Lentzea albidocapillata]|uniref:DddA-like double-stranded DNA deaminase toxin n=1 Tax=Lentzea albidocapillata TaxID=40571 RepID=UPI0015A23A7A|nr:DddA-like double-stranded DNA deaminase toxin [Lentzea albidocapillata]